MDYIKERLASNVTPSVLCINALGLISGMFYTSRFDKIGLFLPKCLYGKDYKKTPFAKYVNPESRELLNSLAPVWLVTSHNDFLQRYTTDFEKALTRAEREHELVDFPKNKKLTHAFSVFEPFLPESSAVINDILEGGNDVWIFLWQYLDTLTKMSEISTIIEPV